MESTPKRPGSITFLLVGLVLLVTAATIVLFVPLTECKQCYVTRDIQRLVDQEATNEDRSPPPLLICRQCQGTHSSSLFSNWLTDFRRGRD
jgi:hypothetical protein